MNSPAIPDVTNPPVLSRIPAHREPPPGSIMRGAYKRLSASTALLTIMTLATMPPAYASGSSMPWEQPLQQILQSIEGPVAKIVAVIIIIATGLALAFGDTSGGFRRLIQIVFGLSIAFAASSFFLSFFSFGGGALV
ncbi:type IV secretion system protein VirB2 [Rhizobium subbaraonis]|uniref:Type IV secretion system protein VirB2 n=2 Tax=Rhizobiaceae TaxID=82115 RepID=A0A285UYQ7_9HYPH|nr:Conjugal transfer protein TrbC [Agrobacterium tumefaciens]SOC46950.1 type IV secretion system protein VirB2 [Rhizobium subbaraonis]